MRAGDFFFTGMALFSDGSDPNLLCLTRRMSLSLSHDNAFSSSERLSWVHTYKVGGRIMCLLAFEIGLLQGDEKKSSIRRETFIMMIGRRACTCTLCY